MSKILDWIKKHIWQTAMIGFGLFFLPLILVHIAYRIPAISPWFASTWQAGELITYIAGFEAFTGTIYLGTVAVKQNQKNIDINDRLLKVEEASCTFLRFPNYKISNCLIEQTSLSKIKDLNTVIFYKKSLDKNQICARENLDQQFHRLSFNIENLTDYNFAISLRKLTLTSLTDGVTKTEYHTVALASSDKHFSIAAKQYLQMGFIIYDSDLVGHPSYLVEMHFLLNNMLNEEFVLTVELVLYIQGQTHIFKVLKENISPLNNVN